MQFISTSSALHVAAPQRGEKPRASSSILGPEKYLSFYNTPPTLELTVDEFEILSLNRLQLLRAIDNLNRARAQNLDDGDKREKEIHFNKMTEVLYLHIYTIIMLILINDSKFSNINPMSKSWRENIFWRKRMRQ